MNEWRAFWRLSGFERGVVLESAAALMATWLGLRLFGFRRWKSFLGWLTPGANTANEPGGEVALATARLVARTEESTARHFFFQPNCLQQSLVLWWLLRLRSIPSELRIGGRKAGDSFEAHAWIECRGCVLSAGGDGHAHFMPFDGPIPNWETPLE